METDDVGKHVKHTARCFDAELHTTAYAETHADAEQLHRLLKALAAGEKQILLDLGTGNGYVAFALTREHPTTQVIGLDIAELCRSRKLTHACPVELPHLITS